MINAGALIVDDVLLAQRDNASEATLELVSDLTGENVEFDRSWWHHANAARRTCSARHSRSVPSVGVGASSG